MPEPATAFEARVRLVGVFLRDQAQWSSGSNREGPCYPELAAWLIARDAGLAEAARRADPLLSEFLGWWEAEHRRYGRRASAGVVATYWRWFYEATPPGMDREGFRRLREELGRSWRAATLDGETLPGPALVNEWLWFHAGDSAFAGHLVEAIVEFEELVAADRLDLWRERRSKRLASGSVHICRSDGCCGSEGPGGLPGWVDRPFRTVVRPSRRI